MKKVGIGIASFGIFFCYTDVNLHDTQCLGTNNPRLSLFQTIECSAGQTKSGSSEGTALAKLASLSGGGSAFIPPGGHRSIIKFRSYDPSMSQFHLYQTE
jgi:hypothetical protein